MRSIVATIACVLLLLTGPSVGAQDLLTLEEAVQPALENNFGVRIARNQEAIAENSNNAGNAGFLPRLNTSGSVSYTSNNTRQQFFSGDERSGTGAGNTAARFSAALTWTAFDGFRMFATRDRLALEEQRSRLFTQRTMRDLVTQVQNAYFQLVRVDQQIALIGESIELNEALRDLAEAKLKIGTGTSLDVLQTSNRLNADSSTLLNLRDQYRQSQINLNRLMGVDAGRTFSVSPELPTSVLPALQELTELAIRENEDIRLLNFDEQIALTRINEARSDLYPTLDLNAGFNYNYSVAEVGFLLSNRTFGPNIGVSFNYDLFPGRNLKKDIANAEILKENIILSKEDLALNIRSDLAALYNQYRALQELLQLETRNVETAERNTALAQELYRSGRATNFEVREAILAEIQVKDRLSDVRFRQKLAENEIRRLAGIPLR